MASLVLHEHNLRLGVANRGAMAGLDFGKLPVVVDGVKQPRSIVAPPVQGKRPFPPSRAGLPLHQTHRCPSSLPQRHLWAVRHATLGGKTW